jgi:hypothetical protein
MGREVRMTDEDQVFALTCIGLVALAIGEKNIRYRKFHPLTYDDIKDDPYYYHSPEPEVDDARIKPVGKQKKNHSTLSRMWKNQFLDWELKGDLS